MADATPVQYAEDVPLPASLETCRLAFWLALTDKQDADPLHRTYIREKAEKLYSAKEWWVIRQMLHPTLWRTFYDYLLLIDPLPETETALNRICAIDAGLLSTSGRSPETP